MTFVYLLFLIIFAVLVWKNRCLALLVIIAALPSYLLRFKVFGIPFTVLEGMILLAAAAWAIELWRTKRKPILNRELLLVLGLVALTATVAVFVSSDIKAALGIWKAYFVEPLLFFIVAKQTFTKRDVPEMIGAVSVGALFVALYGLGQRFLGIPIVAPWQSELRITSIFPYPNAVGLYLAPLIPLFIWRGLKVWNDEKILDAKKAAQLVYWLFVSAVSSAAIYFAKTWGAMVALVAVGGVWGVINKKTRRATVAIALGSILALFLAAGPRHLILQKLSFQSWSGMVRLKIYQETWTMLKDHPVFGAGLAGYQTGIRPYHLNTWMEIFLYPHNIVLAIWSELGLLGLLAFGYLVWWLVKKIYERRDSLKYALGASVSILLIHGLVDVPYFKNDLAVAFWLIVLLAVTED